MSKPTMKELHKWEITKLNLEISALIQFALVATAKCSECGKEMKFNDRICYYSACLLRLYGKDSE